MKVTVGEMKQGMCFTQGDGIKMALNLSENNTMPRLCLDMSTGVLEAHGNYETVTPLRVSLKIESVLGEELEDGKNN